MSVFLRLLAIVMIALLTITLQWEQQSVPIQSEISRIPIFPDEDAHPQLIHIPKGRFTVGSVRTLRRELQSKDRHRPKKVRIDHGFYMMSTELTTRLATRLKPNGAFMSAQCVGNCPAVNFSWREAIEMANLLSEETGFLPCYEIVGDDVFWPNGVECRGYRLPLEEEWEYAAKSGTDEFLYAGGNDLDSVGWYRQNSRFGPNEIAAKKPNTLGLYDMSGNVWEWCWDGWDKVDQKWKTRKVIRGGGWNGDSFVAKIEHRANKLVYQRSASIGVRFVRTYHPDD